MKITQKFNRYVALLLVAIFATTVFISSVRPDQAYAKPYSADDMFQQSEAWVLARALGECLSEETAVQGMDDISEEDLEKGSWFAKGGGQDDASKTVGEYAALLAEEGSDDASHDNDAKAECNAVVKPALEALGYGSDETAQAKLLCEMEFKRDNGSDCISGDGDLVPVEGDDIDLSNDWNKIWERDYLENRINKTDAASSEMRFIIYMWEFQIECGNGEGDGYGRGQDDGFNIGDYNNQDVTDDDQEYQMPWYNFGTGEYLPNQYVKAKEHGSGHGVDISGWGLLTSDDNLQCGTLADRIRGNEAAFKTAYERLVDQNGGLPPGSTGPGGEAEDSCESESGPLAWFGCPLLAMIDGAVGGLSSMIDSLLDIDESTYSNDGVVSAARGLRNVAFIILVPMMMFMVIGTALNFGPFDAYTVKKALPRMFVATLFIALSLPVTTFLVELSNAVGSGLRGFLLTASGSPEGLTEMYSAGGGAIFTTALLAFGGGAVAVAALGTAGAMLGILWSFALVTLLALLIGFITLVLRELLIIVLIIMAPVAILVWIFPGNDKLWGLWKGTFTAMLLMYPLVALLITSGQVFGGVIGDTQNDFVAFFLKIIAYIMPFFFIPAVFRYGLGIFGNIAGIINDRSRGLFDRQRKKRQERYGFVGNKVGNYSTSKRADWTKTLQNKSASSDNWAAKRGLRGLSKVTGGYNIYARASAAQAATAKEINDQIATGDDDEIRALTARKTSEGWKTLAGKSTDEASVMRARQRWGKDVYAQQAALSYEMRKASSEDEAQSIANNYGEVSKDWGMSHGQATGAWIGSAFENQNQHLEYKNMRLNATTGRMEMDSSGYKSFVKEVYEKRGSYNLAQMGSNTIEELGKAYATATSEGDTNTQQRITAIAETFMHSTGYRPGGGDSDELVPDPLAALATPGQSGGRMVNTPGAAHVAERVHKLAEMTGVLGRAPSGTYANKQSGQPNAPSVSNDENTREQ